MLSVKSAAGVQHHLVLLSPQNLTVERRTGSHIAVRGVALNRGRTSCTVGERRNGSVRNAGISVELAVRPAEGNTFLTSPHVSGEVRVVSLHIRPGGGLGQLHLGGARLNIQGNSKLTAGRGSLQLLIGRSRLLIIVLLGILSVGQVCIPVAIRAVQVQVLPCEQCTAPRCRAERATPWCSLRPSHGLYRPRS